jgi:transposase
MSAIFANTVRGSLCGYHQKIRIPQYSWRRRENPYRFLEQSTSKMADLLQDSRKSSTLCRSSFFIMQLLRTKKPGRKIVMILDNAKYHHAKLLKPLLTKHRDYLRLEFLPAYSPDLNPIERVWKLTRRICTHNVHFEKLFQLKNAVHKQHAKWKKPNITLARLCCIT